MAGFSRADLARHDTLLRETARGEILPRFRHLGAGDVHEKNGPLDVVTIADQAAERRITAELLRAFPGAVVVGEEATAADPALLSTLGEADLAFTVDPVDGTSNFADGVPLFAVMVAVLRRGETIAAAILDPISDDISLALRGEGAWSSGPDGRATDLRAAPPVPLGQLTGFLSWRYMPREMGAHVCARACRLGASWDWRCAGHEYRALAAGHCHYVVFYRTLPWDHAPGVLLHQEAGGFAARYDGTPYAPASARHGLICAPDRASFEALREALIPPG